MSMSEGPFIPSADPKVVSKLFNLIPDRETRRQVFMTLFEVLDASATSLRKRGYFNRASGQDDAACLLEDLLNP